MDLFDVLDDDFLDFHPLGGEILWLAAIWQDFIEFVGVYDVA